MSESVEIALLLRLVLNGVASANLQNSKLIKRFEMARWIVPSGRKDEWGVRVDALASLEQRLAGLLPTWREDIALLKSLKKSAFDVPSISALPALRRQISMIGMMNRRNWNAAKGLGPKHRSLLPPEAHLTKDWVSRFRPNQGLLARFSDMDLDVAKIADVLGEFHLPERGWSRFKEFNGVLPARIVTCENIGAYIDLPSPESNMVVFAPGKDIEPAIKLLKALPGVPWIHFGDFDPEVLQIVRLIAKECQREARLFVAPFFSEYLESAVPVKTSWGDVPDIPIFKSLKKAKKRLFQEIFMLDGRLGHALAADTMDDDSKNLIPKC